MAAGTPLNGRNQRGITTDKRPLADLRLVLPHAIVIASDGARADVRFAPDGGISQVGEMARLGAGSHVGLLQLHEISNVSTGPNVIFLAKPRKWTNARSCFYYGLGDQGIGSD